MVSQRGTNVFRHVAHFERRPSVNYRPQPSSGFRCQCLALSGIRTYIIMHIDRPIHKTFTHENAHIHARAFMSDVSVMKQYEVVGYNNGH